MRTPIRHAATAYFYSSSSMYRIISCPVQGAINAVTQNGPMKWGTINYQGLFD